MKKQKIIMDIDPGIDDSIAAILALSSVNLDILGFTLVSGNVDVEQCSKNLTFLLDLLDRSNIPIYEGSSLPLEIKYQDARDTHGEDGLGEVYFAKDKKVESQHAVDYIIEMLNKYPNEITVLALGPLTNMAKIIEKDPEALKKAKSIKVMGGSVDVHGNCSPVAEYNFWVDPHAARIFFNAGLNNIYLYPLDVTYKILFSPNIREMVSQFNTKEGNFIHDITQFYVDFHWEQERTLGCIINDPLVVADLIDPIVEFEKADIDVVVNGIARGESIADKHHKGLVHIGNKVDEKRFFEILLKTIFPNHIDDIDLMFKKEMI